MKQAPRSGRVLATGASVTAAVSTDGLVVSLPGAAPDPDVSVVALEFAQPVTVRDAGRVPTDTGASGTLADPSKSPPTK